MGKGAVHWACELHSLETVKVVCGKHCANVNRVDQHGHTGLCCAIDRVSEATFVEMLQCLIDHGFKLEGETLTIVADMFRAMRPMS
jgi:ankyrin repeat protein